MDRARPAGSQALVAQHVAPHPVELWLVGRRTGGIARVISEPRWPPEYPDVRVTSSVIAGHTTERLLEESAEQAALAVGARTHHPVFGSLLGWVSQGVVHHAHCPVAVVPNRPASG